MALLLKTARGLLTKTEAGRCAPSAPVVASSRKRRYLTKEQSPLRSGALPQDCAGEGQTEQGRDSEGPPGRRRQWGGSRVCVLRGDLLVQRLRLRGRGEGHVLTQDPGARQVLLDRGRTIAQLLVAAHQLTVHVLLVRVLCQEGLIRFNSPPKIPPADVQPSQPVQRCQVPYV